MKILSIETSCDETAFSVIEQTTEVPLSFRVLSNHVLSQIDIHKEYGGVFPAIAKREHAKAFVPLLEKTLRDASLFSQGALQSSTPQQLIDLLEKDLELLAEMRAVCSWGRPNIDAIAVTSGPGLEPALWVGISGAKALSLLWNIPLYPINHMEGHIYASVLEKTESGYSVPDISFPALALLISGGHTELVHVEKNGVHSILGQTRDDAIGEAFDKVARLLGLQYPGGPKISKLAREARSENIVSTRIPALPRPMLHSQDFDFSFSGIKTAVLYAIQALGELSDDDKKCIAREFENAVTEVLVHKCKKAIMHTSAQTLIVGGGVSANTYIREHLTHLCESLHVRPYIPEYHLSTDNALMIGITALLHINRGVQPPSPDSIRANGSLSINSQ